MKKVTTLIVLMNLFFVANSQIGLAKKGDIEEFNMRPVIVVLEAENSDFKKYFNANIKAIFKKYWTFNDKVSFVNRSEYMSMQMDGQDGVAVVAFTQENSCCNGVSHEWDSSSFTHRYEVENWVGCALEFSLIEKENDDFAIFSFIHRETLPNIFPSKGDLIYGLQRALQLFENKTKGVSVKNQKKQIKINAQRLKNKILLIDSSDLDKKVTLEMIKEVYPYPIEIVGYDKIENAIVNHDAKYAYVQISPITSPGVTSINLPEKLVADYSFGVRAIDAEDGLMLGVSKPGMAPVRKMVFGERIKLKHLKRFAKKVE